nr:LLM class F420-dependent oxidoreductase [Nocardia bovistercoris]
MDLVGIDPARQWAVMRDLAQRADAGSVWESLWVYDHFHTVPVPTEEATHEAWTLMSAFAATTSRIRLGQMCTAMSYRNPAYLAKVAATVDLISGGRVEMGIGGGWYEHEWRAYGYGFPSAGDRLRRLDEGVQIFQQAWTKGVATLDGKHYQVDGAIVRPLPLQEGGIPLWVAGGGEKVTLRIAAKYARYTNFVGVPDEFAHKSELLRAHCAEVGTDFDAIVRSSNFNVALGATEAEVEQRLRDIEARATPFLGAEGAAGFVNNTYRGTAAVGTPEQVIENLSKVRALGLEYAIFNFAEAAYDTSAIELFEREVAPALA